MGKETPYKDFEFKPFTCSLCMTHHINLLYVVLTGQFSIYIYMVICMLSFMSKHITGALNLLSDILVKAENKIYDIFNI